jgi:acetyl esterase/lipase
MPYMLRTTGLLASLLCGASTLADAIVLRTNDVEYARVDGQPLLLDLYRLEGGSAEPLLIWIHGGRWEVGSKEQMPVAALVEHGFALASLDFRPASAARFPGQIHDIKAAIRFLRAQAGSYGFDASRIGILGASSGGHLAALVGTTNNHGELEGTLGSHADQSSSVQAIVSYFGASNLTTILRQSTPFGLGVRTPALQTLLGGLPEETAALARLASPVFHVDATDPPLLILHGDQDPQMPINQSHELEGAYRSSGAVAQFAVVHGAGHGGDAFFDAARLALVAEFLDRYLR